MFHNILLYIPLQGIFKIYHLDKKNTSKILLVQTKIKNLLALKLIK